MLEQTKNMMENHLCNYTIGERDHYSPDELRELIEDIVKIETEDAYKRGRFAKQTLSYQTGADDFQELIVRWTDVSYETASSLRKLM